MNSTPHSVLVVDPDVETLFPLAGTLREFGFRVLTATSAAEALQIAIREPLDLALSDLRLVGIGGPQLVEQMRAIRRLHRLAGMFLSTNQDADVVLNTRRGLPEYCLRKPIQPNGIVELIDLTIQSARRRPTATVPPPHSLFWTNDVPSPSIVTTGQPLV